jgi:hypothetical protein
LGAGGKDVPIYRFEPIEGTDRHQYWHTSAIPLIPVWVNANSPDLARQRMQSAVREISTNKKRGNACKPWVEAALVRCTPDDSQSVPRNRALFANDKITLKLP